MTDYKAFWADATAEECCATCARSDGHKCELFNVAFGHNELYDAQETKCTAFGPKEGK